MYVPLSEWIQSQSLHFLEGGYFLSSSKGTFPSYHVCATAYGAYCSRNKVEKRRRGKPPATPLRSPGEGFVQDRTRRISLSSPNKEVVDSLRAEIFSKATTVRNKNAGRAARAIVDSSSSCLEISSKDSPEIKRLIKLFNEFRDIDIDNPNDNDLSLIYSNVSLIRGYSPKMPTLKPTEQLLSRVLHLLAAKALPSS